MANTTLDNDLLVLRGGFWRRFYRLRAKEPLPFTVMAGRIYILPTRQGLAFALLLLGMLIGAINYNLSMGFLFTFLLIGMMLSAMFATWRCLMGVTLQSIESQAGFCGDPVRFTFHFSLPEHVEPTVLRLQLVEQRTNAAIPLQHDGVNCGYVEVNETSTKRGLMHLGRCRLFTEAPLGLFQAWVVFKPPTSVLVWPKLAFPPLALPMHREIGNECLHASQRGTDDFDGLRAYQPGESPSRLAWQSLARQHAENAFPLVKDFVSPVGGAIWLDWASLPAMETEARLSHLARWVLDADRKGLNYGLVLPDQRIAPGVGMLQRLRCLNALALYGLPPEVTSLR